MEDYPILNMNDSEWKTGKDFNGSNTLYYTELNTLHSISFVYDYIMCIDENNKCVLVNNKKVPVKNYGTLRNSDDGTEQFWLTI